MTNLKTMIAQMTIVDETLTEHDISGRFSGEFITLKIENLALLIVRLQEKK